MQINRTDTSRTTSKTARQLLLLGLLCALAVTASQAEAASYKITDLGTLGGRSSLASGINSSGQVVGVANTANGYAYAFLYSNGSMQDLGTLGGSYSSAYAINDSGQVVGAAYTANGSSHAFLYSNVGMRDLGTLGGAYSSAYDINSSSQVVGQAFTENSSFHAFLYSNGSMTDLSLAVAATGWTLFSAIDINDLGQIVGIGTNPDGKDHAFLLTPLDDTPTPVPAAAWLLGSGLAGLVGLRRRTNKAA